MRTLTGSDFREQQTTARARRQPLELGLGRPARPPVRRLHVRAWLFWVRGTICDGREQFPGRSSGRSGESLLGSGRERRA